MISEIIAAYLKDQLPPEREYAVGTYYPGELPFCLRAQYFRYTQPAKALGSDRENLFGVGLLWQACVEEALRQANVTVLEARKIRKLKVPDSSLVLLCEPDFVVEVDGAKLVVELKTAASLAKFSEPMREHVLQLTAYMQVTKTSDALIVYLNKQSGEVKEFPVHLEPENLLLLFERAKRLDQALQDRALPARVGAGQEWQCKSCEFVTECETFHGDGMTDSVRKIGFARVEFDASGKNLEETEEYLLVKNVVLSRQGVFPYQDGSGKIWNVFKPFDELKAGAWTLEGAWIVAYSHPVTDFVMDRDDIRGRVVNIRTDEDKAAVIGDLRFTKEFSSKVLLSSIRNGEMREVSVGFADFDKASPGKFGDVAYDFVQTKYLFNHVAVALVEGRCPSPFCGLSLDGVIYRYGQPWPEITVKGGAAGRKITDADRALFKNMASSTLFVAADLAENYVPVEICKSAPNVTPPRTITLNEKEGILAAIGKSDPAADAEVLRYLFSKAKGWTLEKAEAWVKEHKDSVTAKLNDAAGELSEKELRAKIVELENQRQVLIEKLYPSPPRLPETESRALQLELTLIDGQVHALTEVLAEKLAGVEFSGDSADKGKARADPATPGAKPCKCALVAAREEIERSRRLKGSR